VVCFVAGHLLEYRGAFAIVCRQPAEMIVDVGFDLALGFGNESQTDAIACGAGDQSERECAGIPGRGQQAGAGAEFVEALPRSATGKLLRRVLIERERAGAAR